MKVKVEPKDEFENEELQSGLQVQGTGTMKTNTLDAHGSNNRIKKCGHSLQKKANIPYQCCPFCGNNKFASKQALKNHMMKKHSKDKKLKKDFCFKCDKNFGLNRRFGRKYKLTPDYKINHLIGVYSDCIDSTETESKVHDSSTVHEIKKPEEIVKPVKEAKIPGSNCSENLCLYLFTAGKNQSDYEEHFLTVHGKKLEEKNERRNEISQKAHQKQESLKIPKVLAKPTLAEPATLYKCFGCKKIFKTKELLAKHSRVHDRHITDNPWFKCSICDAVFSSVVFLNQHVVFRHQQNLKVV